MEYIQIKCSSLSTSRNFHLSHWYLKTSSIRQQILFHFILAYGIQTICPPKWQQIPTQSTKSIWNNKIKLFKVLAERGWTIFHSLLPSFLLVVFIPYFYQLSRIVSVCVRPNGSWDFVVELKRMEMHQKLDVSSATHALRQNVIPSHSIPSSSRPSRFAFSCHHFPIAFTLEKPSHNPSKSISRTLFIVFSSYWRSTRAHTHTHGAKSKHTNSGPCLCCAEFFACIHISLNIHAPAKAFVSFWIANQKSAMTDRWMNGGEEAMWTTTTTTATIWISHFV